MTYEQQWHTNLVFDIYTGIDSLEEPLMFTPLARQKITDMLTELNPELKGINPRLIEDLTAATIKIRTGYQYTTYKPTLALRQAAFIDKITSSAYLEELAQGRIQEVLAITDLDGKTLNTRAINHTGVWNKQPPALSFAQAARHILNSQTPLYNVFTAKGTP